MVFSLDLDVSIFSVFFSPGCLCVLLLFFGLLFTHRSLSLTLSPTRSLYRHAIRSAPHSRLTDSFQLHPHTSAYALTASIVNCVSRRPLSSVF